MEYVATWLMHSNEFRSLPNHEKVNFSFNYMKIENSNKKFFKIIFRNFKIIRNMPCLYLN